MEDELVREVDVYLASHLSEHLYLFQFPVREKNLTEAPFLPEARIKPKSRIIELDVAIDTSISSYNKDRGAELGVGMEESSSKTASDRDLFCSMSSKLYDKQTSTSRPVPLQTNYFVGAMKDGQLHLSKIKGLAQFRPSFSAIDKINEKANAVNKRVERLSEKSQTESAPKAIQVQLRKSNLTVHEVSRKSVIEQMTEFKEEPWKELKYYGVDSENSEAAYKYLFCKDMDVEITSKETSSEYLEHFSSAEPFIN